ncbi:MAG: hypothetical protein O3A00_20520, partial [Planctomycetota bacterium]|nr:hypothetical protein [Planctomycetota bacterium]
MVPATIVRSELTDHQLLATSHSDRSLHLASVASGSGLMDAVSSGMSSMVGLFGQMTSMLAGFVRSFAVAAQHTLQDSVVPDPDAAMRPSEKLTRDQRHGIPMPVAGDQFVIPAGTLFA